MTMPRLDLLLKKARVMNVGDLARSLTADKRGNVLMIVGFALVPLTFSTGMVIDYSRAARLQTKLNAVMDAAALSAVTQPMMSKSKNDAAITAMNMVNSQAANLNGLQYTLTGPAVTITSTSSTYDYGAFKVAINQSDTTGLDRTATVSYVARSINKFGGILGTPTLTIKGTSSTSAKIAPNIDFYVMLDVSSSMALPVTSAGIAQMKTLTGGCAFACHQTNPDKSDGIAQYNSSRQRIDFYTAAHNAGILLRVDNGKTAIQDMIDKAQASMSRNKATYRVSVSTFDRASDFKTVAQITDGLPLAKSNTNNAQTVAVTKGDDAWDQQTEHADSMVKMGNVMPTASGTGTKNDTPQSILFLVTDGMRNENRSGQQLGAILLDQCNVIKARPNTRIAVLYTTYDPTSIAGDDWSQRNVAWRLPTVGPALQACASPGLFFEVTTDNSISTAMSALFDKAVSTARITQ
jgi:Flp pilus assembly protein TadG